MRTGFLQPSASGVPNVGSLITPYASGFFDSLYGDGSNLTGVSAGGSTGLGTYEEKTMNDVYQADADGMVIAWLDNYDGYLTGYTDSTSPPTTIIAQGRGHTTYFTYPSITFAVKRGYYYKVVGNAGGHVNWITIGGLGSATEGGLGSWESKTDNTAYLAATDGFVVASRSSNGWIYGYTDSNASPSTLRAMSKTHTVYDSYGSITFPVRAGDYWKTSGADALLFWIPISYGSGNITITGSNTGKQVFTSSGNFTAPAGVTKVYITGCGGGGGGGGVGGGTSYGIGGGGESGHALINYPYTVIPGNIYAVTIGSGGAAGTAQGGNNPGSSGGSGGNSSFDSLIMAGGVGGTGGAAGGSAGGWSPKVMGFSVAGDGVSSSQTFYSGTSAPAYGGGGGMFGTGGAAQSAGTGYGAGGGGTASSNGGAGTSGIVIVEW